MNSMQKADAKRRAFSALDETCPKVDEVVSHLADQWAADVVALFREFALKAAEAAKSHGTMPLREALVDAYGEVVELEEMVRDNERTIDRLQRENEGLRDEIRVLNAELSGSAPR